MSVMVPIRGERSNRNYTLPWWQSIYYIKNMLKLKVPLHKNIIYEYLVGYYNIIYHDITLQQ